MPEAITINADGKGIIQPGNAPSVEFLLLDEFRAFPILLGLQHTNLPESWWHRPPPSRNATVTAPSCSLRPFLAEVV